MFSPQQNISKALTEKIKLALQKHLQGKTTNTRDCSEAKKALVKEWKSKLINIIIVRLKNYKILAISLIYKWTIVQNYLDSANIEWNRILEPKFAECVDRAIRCDLKVFQPLLAWPCATRKGFQMANRLGC